MQDKKQILSQHKVLAKKCSDSALLKIYKKNLINRASLEFDGGVNLPQNVLKKKFRAAFL